MLQQKTTLTKYNISDIISGFANYRWEHFLWGPNSFYEAFCTAHHMKD